MSEYRDWSSMREMFERLLIERTGANSGSWNERIRELAPADEASLRTWLAQNGVTGYPQMYLVMETFGYPDYLTASSEDLIEGQYADRPNLRPIFDAILAAAAEFGPVIIQARKTYVSLRTPRRPFSRVQATTRGRIDLALRLDTPPAGRLVVSHVHPSMKVQVSLSSLRDLDEEALRYFETAYRENQ